MIIALTACGGGGSGNGGNSNNTSNDTVQASDSDGDGVGDNADAFPNDATETLDTDGDGVGDNADALIQVQPTEIGQICRSDEPYYPLPELLDYRMPYPGDSRKRKIEIEASTEDEQGTLEYESITTYYYVDNDDIRIATPSLAPEFPMTPSEDWGEYWSNDYIISSTTVRSDNSEASSSMTLYAGDGIVRTIKSDNDVYAQADTSSGTWKWGQTSLPRLESFTSKSVNAVYHDFFENNKRWIVTSNISVNEVSVVKTEIGCVETFSITENEKRVLQYDDYYDEFFDDEEIAKKIEMTTHYKVHPTLGRLLSDATLDLYTEQDDFSPIATSTGSTFLLEINYDDDLPEMVIGE